MQHKGVLMPNQDPAADREIYVTRARWDGDHDHTLVMDCSDYRLPTARAEFLLKFCSVTRYDAIFVPGGPAVVTVREILCLFERERVKLLHSLHQFRRVVGIAHHDCGYYKAKYPRITDKERRDRQYTDLRNFRIDIQATVQGVRVELYYVAPNADGFAVYTKVS